MLHWNSPLVLVSLRSLAGCDDEGFVFVYFM